MKPMTRTRAREIARRILERSQTAESVQDVTSIVLLGIHEEGWDAGFTAGHAASDGGACAQQKARAEQAEADLNHLWSEMKKRGWKP